MTEIGDLICPHCRSTLRAPMFCEFHAGWRRCVICARPIRITYETARIANRLMRVILAGVPLRVLKRSA